MEGRAATTIPEVRITVGLQEQSGSHRFIGTSRVMERCYSPTISIIGVSAHLQEQSHGRRAIVPRRKVEWC